MTKIVGILNITPDSFSDGGKFNSFEGAINHLQEMLSQGADMIDIGAESTRPNATPISADEEWARLENILPKIIAHVKKFNQENNKNIKTSIDSYHFETIEKSCKLGIDIINDVSGMADEKTAILAAKTGVGVILMHNLSIHADPEIIVNPHINLTQEILNWGRKKLDYLLEKGVKKSQIIFDLGIGFAKNHEQSIRIIKNIQAYKALGLPLYIGHSKKGFLDKIDFSDYEKNGKKLDKSQKTLIISDFLIKNNVDFIRVHDVGLHKKIL